MTNNSDYSDYGTIDNGIGSYLHLHHIIQIEELYKSDIKYCVQPITVICDFKHKYKHVFA